MCADQTAGIRDGPDVGAEVSAELPQPGGMKGQAANFRESSKVNINGSADSSPACLRLFQAATWIGLQIRNLEEIEGDALGRKRASLASPIAKQILLGNETGHGRITVRWARGVLRG